MSDILQKLETLKPEQLAKVFKLINKLANKNQNINDNIEIAKHRQEALEDEAILKGFAEVKVQQPVRGLGRQPTPTHQIKAAGGSQAHAGTLERKVGVSGGQQRKSKSQARRGQGKAKKTFTRREPMNLSGNRPNLFHEQVATLPKADQVQLAKDAEIDKKLAVSPCVPRRPPVEYLEVECSVCGYLFEVHPSLVLKTDEGLTFTCNDCTRTSR